MKISSMVRLQFSISIRDYNEGRAEMKEEKVIWPNSVSVLKTLQKWGYSSKILFSLEMLKYLFILPWLKNSILFKKSLPTRNRIYKSWLPSSEFEPSLFRISIFIPGMCHLQIVLEIWSIFCLIHFHEFLPIAHVTSFPEREYPCQKDRLFHSKTCSSWEDRINKTSRISNKAPILSRHLWSNKWPIRNIIMFFGWNAVSITKECISNRAPNSWCLYFLIKVIFRIFSLRIKNHTHRYQIIRYGDPPKPTISKMLYILKVLPEEWIKCVIIFIIAINSRISQEWIKLFDTQLLGHEWILTRSIYIKIRFDLATIPESNGADFSMFPMSDMDYCILYELASEFKKSLS